ncbi:alpha-amylase family glycosyl hydrolase [Rhodoferax antarcticus]|uniref:Amylosucrase n=1 Tax=Rhodoferax antarcticus ANT.BR TaxID=1111071 RepID=A0A1Q8YJL0_9BURK|nr:alpha-amylase family glycosyl hydrolase [Rhodoferax antarcticus]APW47710.1 alpha-amylase [Rhodoferax antarcticus]MCW2312531.1 amylosucrase [Rhodoferax antarcticus]OLP08244.1 amylosucrase [Rhodoferax antarcticus ANT.BR]
MYEQTSHALLNDILTKLKPELEHPNMRHFYTRLGANFYAIHSLFHLLYGEREDFPAQMLKLVETLARRYVERPTRLRDSDMGREQHYDWFLSQKWVGMAVYCDRFADNLEDMRDKLPYLQDLGVNLLHIMPILACPPSASDGGYAVSDYYKVDPRYGSNDDVKALAETMAQRDMLLVLDVVVNHTSDQHAWAQSARKGVTKYQDYYYAFDDRSMPDAFEQTMPEIFPVNAPGNFTWDAAMGKWVMTVFNHYQWDLNYRNPEVLIDMIGIMLFWANKGVDILRLDAVAFLWKKMGSTCQNEREAHLLLQLMKDCCQVTAPGVLFIAEAIVAPSEIAKYFGEDAINAKECEIAYNATLMALLWDAVATKNARLLNQGVRSLPVKLDRATWLNYVRCHDDIGLGFDDQDIRHVDYDPHAHRQFLLNYFTGHFPGSTARGLPFSVNAKTGDARFSGSLASLVGLEAAIEANDAYGIDMSIQTIITLHAVILSFGGIPLLYYGDAIGMVNDQIYLSDPNKADDNRWMHRYYFDWEKAAKRKQSGTLEYRIFSALKKLIALRKEIVAFADIQNRELLSVSNPNLLVYLQTDHKTSKSQVLVVANFNAEPQTLQLDEISASIPFFRQVAKDLVAGTLLELEGRTITVPALGFFWLAEG